MTVDREGCRFVVRGRVQGVGFRWWTRGRARELGLVGSVRNRPDGTVEIFAAGPPDRLERFRGLLRRGPTSARVEDVREEPSEAARGDEDFQIVR
jgi:acylphosphatase